MFSTVLAASVVLAAALSPALPAFHAAPAARVAVSAARLASYSPDASLAVELTADEREFIDRINAERTERGLYALTPDPTLVLTARAHSWDMSVQSYFGHMAPGSGQRTPMDRYLAGLHTAGQAKPAYVMVGENIYYSSRTRVGGDVLMGHESLMDSPCHRANILDARFARVGVGVVRDGSGRFWVTEMFLRDGG